MIIREQGSTCFSRIAPTAGQRPVISSPHGERCLRAASSRRYGGIDRKGNSVEPGLFPWSETDHEACLPPPCGRSAAKPMRHLAAQIESRPRSYWLAALDDDPPSEAAPLDEPPLPPPAALPDPPVLPPLEPPELPAPPPSPAPPELPPEAPPPPADEEPPPAELPPELPPALAEAEPASPAEEAKSAPRSPPRLSPVQNRSETRDGRDDDALRRSSTVLEAGCDASSRDGVREASRTLRRIERAAFGSVRSLRPAICSPVRGVGLINVRFISEENAASRDRTGRSARDGKAPVASGSVLLAFSAAGNSVLLGAAATRGSPRSDGEAPAAAGG